MDQGGYEQGPGGGTEAAAISGVPGAIVQRAQGDFEFATRLMHVETRKDALAEVGLELDHDLDRRLSEIANMSLREALVQFGGGQQVQP